MQMFLKHTLFLCFFIFLTNKTGELQQIRVKCAAFPLMLENTKPREFLKRAWNDSRPTAGINLPALQPASFYV